MQDDYHVTKRLTWNLGLRWDPFFPWTEIRNRIEQFTPAAYVPMLANYAPPHTWMIHASGLYQRLDLPDVVSMTAPNHLLVQYGRSDTLFPNEAKGRAANKIKSTFEAACVGANRTNTFYDQAHMFSRKMQHEALDWFGKTL